MATAAIGSAGGLAVLEAATFSGVAAGAITGGGNVAMQGGGFGDIAFGAMGGALIGGATGFLGGAAMMGLGNIPAGWVNDVVSGAKVKLSNHNIRLLDVFNDLSYHAGTFGGLGGGLGGNLFQFAGPYQGASTAITYQNFYQQTRNLSYTELINQRPGKWIFPGGPKLNIRYVEHPKNNKIIDMRHFLIVGYWGNVPGAIGEFAQLFSTKSRPSAMNRQDFYSNYLGNKFWRHGYDPKSNDPFSSQLFEWFKRRDPRFNQR